MRSIYFIFVPTIDSFLRLVKYSTHSERTIVYARSSVSNYYKLVVSRIDILVSEANKYYKFVRGDVLRLLIFVLLIFKITNAPNALVSSTEMEELNKFKHWQ